jgi:hypothetical protein|tara:strand:- start:2863 stop:3114 length:252 start_codon:yes stop_codon:yes gene_type:complete
MSKLETRDDELYIGGLKVLKGWESYSGWYWFATELNKDGYHYGYVQGMYDEWGSFSQDELESLGKYKVWKIKDIDLPHAGRRN